MLTKNDTAYKRRTNLSSSYFLIDFLHLFNEIKKMETKIEFIMPTNKKFGIFFSFIFGLLAVYFYFLQDMLFFYSFLFILLVLILITVYKPQLLQPLNKLWMQLGFYISLVMQPLIMGLIYLSLFVPTALLFRICGRDELRLKRSTNNTYWRKITTENPKKHFNEQF